MNLCMRVSCFDTQKALKQNKPGVKEDPSRPAFLMLSRKGKGYRLHRIG